MARFAEGTTVSVEKSRAEIEKLITRYGATSTAFMQAPGRAIICFEAKGRITSFEDEFLAHIVMPDGQTVATHIKPTIEQAYSEGRMLALMPPSKLQ